MNIELLVNQIKGCTFAGLDTFTPIKLRGGKSNPQIGQIFKSNVGSNVMLAANYEAMINRRLEAEGVDQNFTISPLKWGERIEQTPLIFHNDEVYLQTIFIKSGTVSYFQNLTEIAQDSIVGFPTPPQAPVQAGLENKVIVRTYNIRHIQALRMIGGRYENLTHPLQDTTLVA